QFRSPEIQEHPTDLLVPRNEPATLNCHATGRPKPKITWFKDGKLFHHETTGRHVLLDKGDLFFLRVLQTKKDNDTGVYWCVASNTVGKVASRNATLEVAVLSEDFLNVPTNTNLAEGKTALLPCVPPQGHPTPVVTWLKDGIPIDPATQYRHRIVDNGSLAITALRLSDTGYYICKARNVYTERETPPALMTVQVSPHMVSFSKTVTGKEGNTVDLVCRVGGDPPPEVFWRRLAPAGELPLGRMALEEQSQVLRIHHIAPEDTGVYACSAENPVGYITANITLNVHSHPLLHLKPSNARVGVGGTASFECAGSGLPQPTMYWTQEGSGHLIGRGKTSLEGSRISVDGLHTLTIKNVSYQDQGYYLCTAVGVAGAALARVYLEVQDLQDMPPPIIALGAPNQTLPLGTEGEMPCEPRGTPEPDVRWVRTGNTLTTGGRVTITPLGTLRITDLELTDTDVYSCIARSETGETTWTTSLVIANPTNPNVAFFKMPDGSTLPDAPQQVEVMAINATTVTIGWRRGRAGSSSLLGYTVQMWSPDIRGPWATAYTQQTPVTSQAPTLISLDVTDLYPDTRYVFMVRARNSHGISRPSIPTNTVKTISLDAGTKTSIQRIRTRLSQATIRLVTVEALSATEFKATWTYLADAEILEGVNIWYQTLSTIGSNSLEALKMQTVLIHGNGGGRDLTSSHVITGLHPATQYEVFVVPFHQQVEGQPTGSVVVTMLEAAPAAPPLGIHYTTLNTSHVEVTWDPIPEHDANGHILGYNLQVTRVDEHDIVQNLTVNNSWVILGEFSPGETYGIQINGRTSKGPGPLSTLLLVQTTIVDTAEQNKVFPPMSLVPLTNNSSLIISITATAITAFVLLGVVVFCIYKKQQEKHSSPQFYGKTEVVDSWSEYPGYSKDTDITSTMYTEIGNGVISHFYQQLPSPDKLHYDQKTQERLYEELNKVQLESFNHQVDQRCGSPEPYATTPLIANLYHNTSGQSLPPNIPVNNTGRFDSTAQITHQHLQNFNSYQEKGVSKVPVLHFPPPPMEQIEGNNSTENTITATASYHQPNSMLQHLNYRGGSSSMSHRSHNGLQVGPIAPSTSSTSSLSLINTNGECERRLINSQLSPHQQQLQEKFNSTLGTIPLDTDSDMECYSQPIHNGRLHRGEESDGSHYYITTYESSRHPENNIRDLDSDGSPLVLSEGHWKRKDLTVDQITNKNTYDSHPTQSHHLIRQNELHGKIYQHNGSQLKRNASVTS
ncbi:unnamed protein product, partial [Meganyctiphanes norvegica]